jgi:hypothetical protein
VATSYRSFFLNVSLSNEKSADQDHVDQAEFADLFLIGRTIFS